MGADRWKTLLIGKNLKKKSFRIDETFGTNCKQQFQWEMTINKSPLAITQNDLHNAQVEQIQRGSKILMLKKDTHTLKIL